MSYIRKKVLNSGKIAAYEIIAKWDPEKKQSRSVSSYLGMVDPAGKIIPKGSRAKPRRKKKPSELIQDQPKEKLIQDFGNAYLVSEFIKKSSIYESLLFAFEAHQELLPLMTYRICDPGPMYNCQSWLEGTVLSTLFAKASAETERFSSQNISRILAYMGEESVQRRFFENYFKKKNIYHERGKKVIIDATSLQNQICSDFNAWGHSENGIERQFRFHCVVDLETKSPMYYRSIPGNITDVSTLETTISELKAMGVESSYALLDAGFFSETNIQFLYQREIDFLIRIPLSRLFCKTLIKDRASDLENLDNAFRYGKRALFGIVVKTNICEHDGFVYLILDPAKRSKDITQLVEERSNSGPDDPRNEEQDKYALTSAGVFALGSSKEIPLKDVMESYYIRQTAERIFGNSKDDLDILPIRCHSETTIRGYLFMQFLLLIVFTELRKLLNRKTTIEQALLVARQLKCKVFSKIIVVQELTRKQKDLFESCSIIVPTSLGI
jgi:transposase